MKNKIPNYSYFYAKSGYEKLRQYEVSTTLRYIQNNEQLIIRLDGKGLTDRFKDKKETFLPEFHLAMKRVLDNIKKYCAYVKFAYSFKDEISLLLNKEYIQNNKPFENRLEKILPIISGYISAMFSQYISKKLKSCQTEAFSFDARVIIIPNDLLQNYFHMRQSFAMAAFIDRLCAFYNLNVERNSLIDVKKALVNIGLNWNSFPQYVCSGYVGYEKEKWIVETASDFFQKWEKYAKYLDM